MIRFEAHVNEGFGFAASLCDASGQRLLVSDCYAGLLMRSREELLRAPWQTIVHPEDFKDLATPFSRMIARSEPYELQCRVLRGDGVWVPLHYRVCPHDGRGERILFQTNVAPIIQAVEHVPPSTPPETAVLAEYIRELSQQLGHLAGERKMAMLHHLLAMASAEAGEELVRIAAENRSLVWEHHRTMH